MQIKIAVAINAEGEWYAFGSSDVNEDESSSEALNQILNDTPTRLFIINVEVPIPDIETTTGIAEQINFDQLIEASKLHFRQAASELEIIKKEYEKILSRWDTERALKEKKITENIKIPPKSFWAKLFGY